MLENWISQFEAVIGTSVPSLVMFLLKVLLCIVIFFIGRKVISWLIRMLNRTMARAKLQEGAVTFSCSVAKILLYCILILGIAIELGVTEASVAALVASIGVAIGLGFQGGLSNLAGGFLLLISSPFQVGDYISTQDVEGTVEKIEIIYTTLLTADNRRVVIPNGTLSNSIMVNVTSTEKRRLEIKISISYQDDLNLARKILERLAEEQPLVLQEEGCTVSVFELAENGVVLGLRCWVASSDYYRVLWDLNEKIKTEFDRAGLHIPYPQMEVHLSGGDPARK